MKTACRILFAPAGTSPTDLRDIIIMDQGMRQYDAVSPWCDLGASKSGWTEENGFISFQLAERIEFHDKEAETLRDSFALALLWQDMNRVIHGAVWSMVMLDHHGYPPPRGEASVLPVWVQPITDKIEL